MDTSRVRAWQAVDYAAIPERRLGRQLRTRPDRADERPNRPPPRAKKVFGIDNVPARLEMAQRNGIEAIDADQHEDISATIRGLTDGTSGIAAP